MIAFILEDQNLPFMVSLTIMLMIACLEGVTTILGMGLSNLIEAFIPDFDLDIDADADLDNPDITSHGLLTKTFGWFRLGQVPFLIILIAFLTIFGLCGLILQSILISISGYMLPSLIASGITLVISLPMIRFTTGIIARIMPKDETEAVAEKSFIGRIATITLGKAEKNKPAQAKLKDKYGTTHYVMVEPDVDGELFEQGEQVLLVRQTGSGYKGIHNSVSALQEMD